MPTIKKQTKTRQRKSNSKGQSVIDRIAPIPTDLGYLNMVLYGASGKGKTRFACTFPKKVLLIGAEDGTKSVAGDKGVYFAPLYTSQELWDLIELLRDRRDYETVVLDTASMLQDLILKEILGLEQLPAQKSWGMATREQYGQCSLSFCWLVW